MLSQTVLYFVAISCYLGLGQGAATLPSYIKKCSLSDANLGKCMTEAANNAISTIIKGDRTYRVSSMTPLDIPLIDLGTGGLNLKLIDAKISNFETIVIESIIYDVKNSQLTITIKLPSMIIDSKYKAKGQILILPVRGDGPSKITLDKGTYIYTTNLKTIQKKNKDHLSASNSECKIDLGGATFNFDNLFNGDKRLGDEVNKFINENWSDVMNEFYPAIKLIVIGIIDNALNGYFGAVPKQDLFDS